MEFANPWFMAAGGAMVSAPVIIHLINRMRFRRVRWAAMEFLLKSQKRNRRKLIIEQLILLLLRCLLVLLAGLLLSRLHLWGDTGEKAVHYVVLDDTPSMADHWVDGGKNENSFEVAKEQLATLAQTAAQASSPQEMKVALLSDPGTLLYDQQLNSHSDEDLREKLADVHPKAAHVDPLRAVEKAKQIFLALPRGKKVFHFLSDFRDKDWVNGPGSEALTKGVDELIAIPANVSYIDTAHRYRGQSEEGIAPHSNLAIEDLKAQTAIVAEGVPVEFTVGIRNYSTEAKKTFMKVFTRNIYVKEGKLKEDEKLSERVEATTAIDNLQPGRLTEQKFTLLFNKNRKIPELEVKDTDKPEEKARKRRADQEFVQVSVQIDDDPKEMGLEIDNVRDMVVEVRTKVPTLVVDGDPAESRQRDGDVFYLEIALKAARSFEMERCTVADLPKVNLNQYPNVMFVNVPIITDKQVLDNLKDYVQNGGSVSYFMGYKTQPAFYNDVLYKQYEGLFPLLIDPRLPEPMTDAEKEDRLQKDPQPKILFKDPANPIVAALFKNQSALRYLLIDRYYHALPQTQWDPTGKETQVVVNLPNRSDIGIYKAGAQDLARRALEKARDLASDNAKEEKYVPVLEKYLRKVQEALNTGYLFNVVQVFDSMLNDPGAKDDPARPNMPELWAEPKMKAVAAEIKQTIANLQFGDPLIVTRHYGKGRVLAFLTSAGTAPRGNPGETPMQWNDWASGRAIWSYPVFMMQMQRYLISESDSRNRLIGSDLALDLDAARYEAKVVTAFQPQPDPLKKDKDGAWPAQDVRPELPLNKVGERYKPSLLNVDRPGVYTFEFFPTVEGGPKQDPEIQAFAVNIDSQAESDLSRAAKEKLLRKATFANVGGKVTLRSPGDPFDEFKDPPPELSDMLWLFLIFAAVLLAEQAMAVHLSFHLKEHEAASGPPPTVRKAAAA